MSKVYIVKQSGGRGYLVPIDWHQDDGASMVKMVQQAIEEGRVDNNHCALVATKKSEVRALEQEYDAIQDESLVNDLEFLDFEPCELWSYEMGDLSRDECEDFILGYDEELLIDHSIGLPTLEQKCFTAIASKEIWSE